jgi:hypothetical protein
MLGINIPIFKIVNTADIGRVTVAGRGLIPVLKAPIEVQRARDS